MPTMSFLANSIEALGQDFAGQGPDPFFEHGGHDLAVHPLFAHGLLVLDRRYFPREKPGQGIFRSRRGQGLVDIGLGLGRRLYLAASCPHSGGRPSSSPAPSSEPPPIFKKSRRSSLDDNSSER